MLEASNSSITIRLESGLVRCRGAQVHRLNVTIQWFGDFQGTSSIRRYRARFCAVSRLAARRSWMLDFAAGFLGPLGSLELTRG